MAQHRQSRVKAPPWTFRKRIRVDAGMVPLLRELWARGLMTTHSCEDMGDGSAYIIFACPEMATAFAEIVTGCEDPSGWRFEDVQSFWPGMQSCAVWFPRELVDRRDYRRAS